MTPKPASPMLLFKPWTVLKRVAMHNLQCLETLLNEGGMKSLVVIFAGLIVFWHLYTPIHELLHVAACLLSGGTVEELALKPQYGGTLLAEVFPFVVPESDYAGQLTGFHTPNYWSYALVDFFPYGLSLFGVALAEWCRRRKRSLFFGLAAILTFVPLMSVPGDFYEAVSLVTTQIAEWRNPQLEPGFLVSDDMFRSIGSLGKAGKLDFFTGVLVFLGFAAAVWLSITTLAFQLLLAERWFGLRLPADTEDEKNRAPSRDLES